MIMKRPSMRSAKIDASATVARNSDALMRVEAADGLDIDGDFLMNVRMRAQPRLAFCNAPRPLFAVFAVTRSVVHRILPYRPATRPVARHGT
jgi:hypothetical protein